MGKENPLESCHLVISGQVQGVFFRATAKEIAGRFNITGWIRNTDAGNVEAQITGKREDLAHFIEWCKKGPENARVDDVQVDKREVVHFPAFEVIRRS